MMPGAVEQTQRSFRPMRRVRCRRGLLFAEGFRRLCAIGKCPIVAHAMAAAIRAVGRAGVDPVQRIEEAVGRARAGIGTCRNLDRSFMTADAIGGKRGTGNVAGEPLEWLGISRRERLPSKHGKLRMNP